MLKNFYFFRCIVTDFFCFSMSTVLCQFDKCGLHFVNKFELVHHIEEDHIRKTDTFAFN